MKRKIISLLCAFPLKNKIISILCIFPSFAFLLFYVPMWNGKHLLLHVDTALTGLFIWMVALFVLGLIGVLAQFIRLPHKLRFLKWFSGVSMVLATPVFLLFAVPFTLWVLGIPPIPSQH